MKPLRWSGHALETAGDGKIDRVETERTIASPEFTVEDASQVQLATVG